MKNPYLVLNERVSAIFYDDSANLCISNITNSQIDDTEIILKDADIFNVVLYNENIFLLSRDKNQNNYIALLTDKKVQLKKVTVELPIKTDTHNKTEIISQNNADILYHKENNSIYLIDESKPNPEQIFICNDDSFMFTKVVTKNKCFDTFMRVLDNKIELIENNHLLFNQEGVENSMTDEMLAFVNDNKDAFKDKIDYNSVVVDESSSVNIKNLSMLDIEKQKEVIKNEMFALKKTEINDSVLAVLKNINESLLQIKTILDKKKRTPAHIHKKKKIKNGQK